MEESLTQGTVIPSTMSTERTGYGEGFSEGEALLNWFQTDPELMKDGVSFGMTAFEKEKPVHVNMVRKSKLSKRVAKTKAPKSTVKGWSTAFILQSPEGVELGVFENKADAVKAAKLTALQDRVEVTLHRMKKPKSDSTLEMTFTPGASEPARYKFKASFRF